MSEKGKVLSREVLERLKGKIKEAGNVRQVQVGDKFELIDENGTLLLDEWFDELEMFEDGYGAAKNNEHWFIVTPQFELNPIDTKLNIWMVADYANEVFIFFLGSRKYVYVDISGKQISNYEFDSAKKFIDGNRAIAKLGKKFYCLYRDGRLEPIKTTNMRKAALQLYFNEKKVTSNSYDYLISLNIISEYAVYNWPYKGCAVIKDNYSGKLNIVDPKKNQLLNAWNLAVIEKHGSSVMVECKRGYFVANTIEQLNKKHIWFGACEYVEELNGYCIYSHGCMTIINEDGTYRFINSQNDQIWYDDITIVYGDEGIRYYIVVKDEKYDVYDESLDLIWEGCTLVLYYYKSKCLIGFNENGMAKVLINGNELFDDYVGTMINGEEANEEALYKYFSEEHFSSRMYDCLIQYGNIGCMHGATFYSLFVYDAISKIEFKCSYNEVTRQFSSASSDYMVKLLVNRKYTFFVIHGPKGYCVLDKKHNVVLPKWYDSLSDVDDNYILLAKDNEGTHALCLPKK